MNALNSSTHLVERHVVDQNAANFCQDVSGPRPDTLGLADASIRQLLEPSHAAPNRTPICFPHWLCTPHNTIEASNVGFDWDSYKTLSWFIPGFEPRSADCWRGSVGVRICEDLCCCWCGSLLLRVRVIVAKLMQKCMLFERSARSCGILPRHKALWSKLTKQIDSPSSSPRGPGENTSEVVVAGAIRRPNGGSVVDGKTTML